MNLPDAPAIGPARRGSEGDNPGPSLPRRTGVAPVFAMFKNRVRMLTPAHPVERRRPWYSPTAVGHVLGEHVTTACAFGRIDEWHELKEAVFT